MSIAIILVGVALKLRIPYPITLVLGGVLLGFFPGLSEIYFSPSLVLVTVLPPILYHAAYSIHFKEFKKNINDILWLGLGLVFATTFVIGIIFKWMFPELPWAVAFTFGAIISPPDAVAATSILRRFSIGPRLLTTLEGESLINDAAGLLLYKLSVVALLSGTFSFTEGGFEFIKIVTGGAVIGVLSGLLLHSFSSYFFNSVLAVVFSFVIPYLAFLLADAFEFSGVLSVVICGLIGSRMLVKNFSSFTRIVGWSSWDIFIIFLNCFIFILIGLQLHGVVQRLTFEKLSLYIAAGILLTLSTILIRFICVYMSMGISLLFRKKMAHTTHWTLNDAFILSWSGMRGIVSLIAALALPYSMPDGSPLPGRDLIIFLTFIVILLTLIIPGLTLPSLMRILKFHPLNEKYNTKQIRQNLLIAAHEEIEHIYKEGHIDDQEYSFLLTYFKLRHQILEIASQSEQETFAVELAQKKVLLKKREYLLRMWENNEIDDHLFNMLENEIDLEESNFVRAII